MRRRNDVDAPERVDHGMVEPAEVAAAHTAVVMVDDALRATKGRTLVDRSEVIGMLQRVESAAHDLPDAELVVEIADRLDRDSSDQDLVPQRAVVDALLDMRSVLIA